jgi:hypothetical protein
MKIECELCGSKNDELNFHHLIPVSQHNRNPVKKLHERHYMKSNGIYICKYFCHRQIHKLITEKEMSLRYYTKELLISNADVIKYIDWRSKRV